MPKWQHISYSVVVIDLMEKVHPGGGDSWLHRFLCEYTEILYLKLLILRFFFMTSNPVFNISIYQAEKAWQILVSFFIMIKVAIMSQNDLKAPLLHYGTKNKH